MLEKNNKLIESLYNLIISSMNLITKMSYSVPPIVKDTVMNRKRKK